MPKIRIFNVNVIPIKKGRVIVNVVKVCYEADRIRRCIWIDEENFTEENVKRMIKADLEKAKSIVGGEIEI